MTAVASPSSVQTSLPRNGWSNGNDQISLNAMSHEEVQRMFIPRKSVQRSNSSSSLSSTSSTGTVTSAGSQINGVTNGDANNRKKPARGFWPSSKAEPVSGLSTAKSQSVSATNSGPSATSAISALHNTSQSFQQQPNATQLNGATLGRLVQPDAVPMLVLVPLNNTFERKAIAVPQHPDVLKIGRQTNAKTAPSPNNLFFDSKVLSRQHAEVWSDADGKIWLRDVRSSNGTHINSRRLSPENRDSEPHLLKEQDVLELGIDIVSEDGKTIVHHKVAARVEVAGICSNRTNEFGAHPNDPSNIQWGPNFRPRPTSSGSLASSRSAGTYASAVSGVSQGKWLQPVTMEQIVKKLNTELKQARLQSADLKHTGDFVESFLNQEQPDFPRPPPTKSASPAKIADVKSRLATEPPAPPPSQPLPEKPDAAVPASRVAELQPSLRRSDTERGPVTASAINAIANKSDAAQISNLVEALSTAHKEMASQSEKIRVMEEALRLEREARSTAEQRMASQSQPTDEGAAEGASDTAPIATDTAASQSDQESRTSDDVGDRLERMNGEMDRMRQQVERFRLRAEAAEQESQRDRQTLAEMVASIRKRDEQARKRKANRAARQQASGGTSPTRQTREGEPDDDNDDDDDSFDEILSGEMHDKLNGRPFISSNTEHEKDLAALAHARGTQAFADTIKDFSERELDELGKAISTLKTGQPATASIAVRSRTQEQLAQASPYASLLGVVLLGVATMAYLNGWQKVVDR